MRCRVRRAWGVWMGAVLLLNGSLASAQAPGPVSEAEQKERIWKIIWPKTAVNWRLLDGQYVKVPAIDPRYPSSAKLTREALRRTLTISSVETVYGSSNTRRIPHTATVVSPDEDLDLAINALPQVELGAYGRVHSLSVAGTAADGGLLIASLKLVPPLSTTQEYQLQTAASAELRKLPGLSSARTSLHEVTDFLSTYRRQLVQHQTGMLARTRLILKGVHAPLGGTGSVGPLHIVIVARSNEGFIAYPTSVLDRTMTEDEFVRLLEQRGIRKADVLEFYWRRFKRNLPDSSVLQAVVGRIDKATDGSGWPTDPMANEGKAPPRAPTTVPAAAATPH